MTQPLISELSRRNKLKIFLKHVSPNSSILEVGRGDGWFSSQLQNHGHRVTSLDLVPPADIVGDVLKWKSLGLKAGAFDAVVALEVIEHVDCVQALSDLCRPNGTIFLSSPHPQWDWVMQALEQIGANQKRTSPHDNLIDFQSLPWRPLELRRPAWIHQVGVFVNVPK
jgi:2-polyprenyl-3-methyl-5-hydroxy-6-metoxy-1,4-benzoquinol methylase